MHDQRLKRTLLAAFILLAVPLINNAAVLTPVSIDGDLTDWSQVLSDPYQAALDGPAGALPDLDGPVQSTGRDLTSFAWTYDTTYFYLYTSRSGSSRNRQLFWYYLDFDADGLMSAGEPVFHISWWGRSRRTETALYLYLPAAPGGDPLGDSQGLADGWTMPGTLTGETILETATGGSASGTEMEARLPWDMLGVAAGTPFLFHVSSSNSANIPDQIDDNMGGPAGVIGSTFFAGVVLQPDRSGTLSDGGSAAMAHTLTNTGQNPDIFNLTAAVIAGFSPESVTFHADLNSDGILDPGDQALTDTNGDGLPDSGLRPTSAPFNILAVITAPSGLSDGDTTQVLITARSVANPAAFSAATETLTVSTPSMTLVKSVNRADAAPGDTLTYQVVYTSNGSSNAYNATITDEVPSETTYVTGSASSGGATLTFSHDGGLTYDNSDSAPVSHIRWTLLAPLSPGSSGTISFQVRVN